MSVFADERQVAADYLELGGFSEFAEELRSGMPTPAFLTGSRAYGTPREDSDIDLVCVMRGAESDELRNIARDELRIGRESNYPSGIAFRLPSLRLPPDLR